MNIKSLVHFNNNIISYKPFRSCKKPCSPFLTTSHTQLSHLLFLTLPTLSAPSPFLTLPYTQLTHPHSQFLHPSPPPPPHSQLYHLTSPSLHSQLPHLLFLTLPHPSSLTLSAPSPLLPHPHIHRTLTTHSITHSITHSSHLLPLYSPFFLLSV